MPLGGQKRHVEGNGRQCLQIEAAALFGLVAWDARPGDVLGVLENAGLNRFVFAGGGQDEDSL
jgi:hypothetical protein